MAAAATDGAPVGRSRKFFGQVTFTPSKRGYDQVEVDAFLEQAGHAIERLLQRLREAEAHAGDVQGQIESAQQRAERAELQLAAQQGDEGLIQRTLSLAERTAVAAVADAKRRAEEILQQANLEAANVFATERRKLEDERRGMDDERQQLDALRLAVAAETHSLEQVRANLRDRVAAAAAELDSVASSPDLLGYRIAAPAQPTAPSGHAPPTDPAELSASRPALGPTEAVQATPAPRPPEPVGPVPPAEEPPVAAPSVAVGPEAPASEPQAPEAAAPAPTPEADVAEAPAGEVPSGSEPAQAEAATPADPTPAPPAPAPPTTGDEPVAGDPGAASVPPGWGHVPFDDPIVGPAAPATPSTPAAPAAAGAMVPPPAEGTAAAKSFEAQWEHEAALADPDADRAFAQFFSDQVEQDPSQSWILKAEAS